MKLQLHTQKFFSILVFFLSLFFLGFNVNAQTIHNTNTSQDYFTIQAAIDDVLTLNGHTITIDAGTYNEQVIVNKELTIKSATATQATIDFTGIPTGKLTLFDVTANNVTIENLHFNVNLSKLRSAVIASSAGLETIVVKDNLIDAYGTPAGSYGERNAVSINYAGYRVATGGVNSVTFTGNTVNGAGPSSYFRSGISADEVGGTFSSNTATTINHDILVRFGSNGPITISNNTSNGGGIEATSQNAGCGTVTISNNTFTGAGAPNTAVLRLKNNNNSIVHVISGNTFTNYQWAISSENMNSQTFDNNIFTTASSTARALVINTKSISSDSNTILQVAIGATIINNNFNGTGNAITFQNHDSDNDSYGTITLGTAGNENDFASSLSSFVVFDAQTGTSTGSTFPTYPGTGGWPTTMACWDQNLDAQNNNYDVGAGLQLPYVMSLAQRASLETKLTHDVDNACLGLISYYFPIQNVTQNTYYTTIQSAIDAATIGDTLSVPAGTYAENLIVSKSLTILGPNANISPCSGTRTAEAILTTAVSDIAGNTAYSILDVQASNVTIKGFTVDGDNTNITTGFTSTTSADIDIAVGITRYVTGNNINIENNIVQNVSYFGIELYDFPAGIASSGNVIANNKIQDLGTYDVASGINLWGGGVLLYNNQYAAVTNNCMTNVRIGLQTGNFYQANPGSSASQVISGNTIEARRRGIFHNLAYSAASPFTFSGNTITGLANANETAVWDGFLLGSIAVGSTASNNTINGATISTAATYGVSVWNCQPSPLVSGGTISNVQFGVNVNNFEGYPTAGSNAGNTSATIDGVTISSVSVVGIRVNDNASNTNGATVSAEIKNSTINSSAAAKGILISGSDATANIHDNSATITGLLIGIDVDGGSAAITTSKIDANGTGVRVKNSGTLTSTTQNFITNNTVDGISIEASAGAIGVINNNDLSGNAVKAINNASAATLAATCNWYGSNVPATIAGKISGSLTYIPYLTAGTDDGIPTNGFQPAASCSAPCALVLSSSSSDATNCTAFNNGTATVNIVSGGSGSYTFLWSNGQTTNPATGLVAGNYAVTVFDANGCTAATSATVVNNTSSSPVHNTTTGLNYCTIQSAIDDSQTLNGHTITVDAGTYAENIIVSKSLTITGPNAANSGCGSRVAEAIVVPATSAVDSGEIFHVAASNVTISGFTIDGDNPSLAANGYGFGGADMHAAEGVTVYETGINNLTVTNNIIRNLSYFGVTLYDYPAGVPSSGHVISNNKIENLGTYDVTSGIDYWGGGVLLYNNQYASVTSNCMNNVRLGVQTGNFSQANPGLPASQLINGNTMTNVRRTGVFHNLAYSTASPFTISNNTISGVSNANETKWNGVSLFSISVGSSATGNTISGAGVSQFSKGIEVWNVKSSSPATISGGSLTSLSNGVAVNNYDGYASDATDGAHATISNVVITPSSTGTGIRVLDSPSSTTHANVRVAITGCTISGGLEGVKFEETLAGAVGGSINGNTISASAAGININSMLTSATNVCSIANNNITLTSQVTGGTPTVGIFLRKITGTTAATISSNTIAGAFYGYLTYNLNTTPVSDIDGGTITGAMQGVALLNIDPITLAAFAPSNTGIKNITMSGFAGVYPALPNNNFHAGVYAFTGGPVTTASITSTLTNLNVSGTGKISGDSSGLSFSDFSTGAGNRQNITINECNISNNLNRGINIRGGNALVDINSSTIANNGSDSYGLGGNEGFGIIAREGAVVTIDNCFIANPATVAGIYNVTAIAADAGASPSVTITATSNSVVPNGNTSSKLATNSGGTFTATCNWWGSTVTSNITPYLSGVVSFIPYLSAGTDDGNPANGFQPQVSCSAPCALVASVDLGYPQNASCFGTSDGSINVSVTSGGTGSYTYQWTGTDYLSAAYSSTSANISGLKAGTYNVTITDANGCTTTISSISVTQPAIPPVFNTPSPASLTVACGGVTTSILHYDNGEVGILNISGDVTSTLSPLPGACGGTVTESWDIVLACATLHQERVITVSPAAVPTMIAPAAITVACGGLPAPSTLTFTNGLSGGCLVSGTSASSTFTTTPGACGGTVTETWTATDICGRVLASVSRVITVSPAALPTMIAPAAITVACGGLPSASTLPFTNGLSGGCLISGTSANSTFTATPDACGGTVTQTWTATDTCGRVITSVSRVITVSPAALPTMIAPAAITVACGGLPSASTLPFTNGLSGGCLVSGTSANSTFTATPGACGGTVTQTWTATDVCGRALASVSRIITVSPAALPTMTAPSNITVACGGLPSASTLPFTNGLSGGCLVSGTSATSTFTATPGACGGTVTQTWTATDVCGRALASVSRIITVSPAALPTMTAPSTITVACGGLPAPSTLPFSNGLSGGCLVNGTSNPSTFSITTACGGSVTETWTATDSCGRALVSVSRVITVTPAVLPTMTAPGTITVACGSIPAPSTISFSNGFSAGCLISGTSNPSTFSATPGACGGIVTETWTATDSCGRALTPVTRVITVDPAALPTMTAPGPITVACGGLPAASTLPFSNGLSVGCAISGTSSLSTFSSITACGGTVIQTWRATDSCGRALTPVTRVITVLPAAPPVFASNGGEITVFCGAAESSPLTFTNGGSGGCLISGTVFSTLSAANSACGQDLIETWTRTYCTATGAVGTITSSRVIHVLPAAAPAFVSQPDITVACGAAITSSLAYTNEGSGECLISGTATSTLSSAGNPACGLDITETWTATYCTATGAVGTITSSRVIHVLPAAAPTFASNSGPITVACGAAVTSSLAYTNGGSGTCLISGTATSTLSSAGNTACGQNITETWTVTYCTATGAVGTITSSRVITVLPAATPTFTSNSGPITVACGAAVTSSLAYTNGGSGACLIGGTVTSTLSSAGNTACGQNITETWTLSYCTATGAAGTITSSRLITVLPAALPTMSAPANITVACGGLPASSTLPFTNGLGGVCLVSGTSATSTFTTTPGVCGGAVTETWTATDLCGRALASVSRVITVSPAALPTMTSPANITVACGSLPGSSTLSFTNGLSGGCLVSGTSASSTFTTTPGACGGTVTETWTATDVCGRALASVSRVITVSPAALPTMSAPGAITVACGGIPGSSTLPFTNGLSGGCLVSGTSASSTFTTTPGACGGTVTETWTATDVCGRALASVSRVITVSPATLPTISAPGAITVACGGVPGSSTLPFTNGLSGGCLVSGTSASSTFTTIPGACGGTVTETWTATDVCGRALASVSRVITVSPAALPTMSAPAAITVVYGSLPAASTLPFSNGLSGGCLISGTSNVSTSSAIGPCGGIVTQTWTATDSCGRALASVSRIITVTPVLIIVSNVAQSTIVCNGGSATVTITASGGTGGLSYTFDGVTNTTGIFTHLAGTNLPYSVTDANGCVTVTGTFTIVQPAAITSTVNAAACNTYTWALPLGNGQTYTTSQTGITNASINGSGCTHTQTLNLTINNSTTNGNLTVSAVGSYTWAGPLGSGITYTSSGVYTSTTTNASGCPNVATLNLTVIVNTFTVGQSCGTTIANLSVTINTPIVVGATTYTFRVTNMVTNAVQTTVRVVNSFALSNLAGITLGTPYQIEVSINNGPFGPPCAVSTPTPFSNIEGCGTTLSNMTQFVTSTFATSVPGYRFRITNTTTNAVQIFDTILNKFQFSQLPSRSFATVYFVEVALQNTDGSYFPYSAGCNITTPPFPLTRIRPLQCGAIATGYTENYVAIFIAGSSDYRFNLYNTTLGYNSVLERPLNTYNLSLFSGLLPSTTYSIRVAVKIDGVWSPYGVVCSVTTPGATRIAPIELNMFKVLAYPNPFAQDFKFDIKTSSQSTIQIKVYDMLGKQIDNRNVEVSEVENLEIGANYPSGVYNVIVSQSDQLKTLRVIKR